MRKNHPGRPVIQIVGGETLQEELDQNLQETKRANALTSLARTRKELLLAVVRSSDTRVLQHFSEVSDVHMRLIAINGTIILQSIIPSSSVYALLSDADKELDLIPLV